MTTPDLVDLVNKCREIAWHEGGAKTGGDYSAIVPLLNVALVSESLRTAIMKYEAPKPTATPAG